ncbi:MAG: SIMPL domain-containing protein [Coriobacteriia bacterium]|nr:SIMPL domain-containing protein [Coriobacteriia bacterium]
MFTKSLVSSAILALAATVALAGCQTKVVSESDAQPPNTVSARGTGTALGAPDQAEMSFGLTVNRKDARSALADASAAAKKVAAAVKKAGIPADDIQTQNVSVYPQYSSEGKDRPPTVTGYSANISVRVRMRDIEKIGAVITAATDAGATEISGPSFSLSEDAPVAAEAIEKAVSDARRRANAMAEAAGKAVGEVLSISEAAVTAPPVYGDYYGRSAAADVPIEPGQIDVTAQVVVVFELK